MMSGKFPLKRFALAIIAPVMGLIGLASTAQAVPITYTFSGVGTAFLNGQTYTNQLVTFTLTADTGGVTISSPGTHADDLGRTFPYNPGLTQVTVGGVTDTLADFPGNEDTAGDRT